MGRCGVKWLRRFLPATRADIHHLIIYLETALAQIDDLNAAIKNLTDAVAALPSRITPAPDLSGATSAVQSAADAINAINPAPVEPTA